MTNIITILIGILIAVILDWAIYTHLSAYLRAGLALDSYFAFRDLLITRWQRVRFFLVIVSGAAAGLAFAEQDAELWILALIIFLISHSFIYAYVVRR